MSMHTVIQYGNETEEEEGVVYPGEVGVRVDLDPGDIACSATQQNNVQ